MRDNDEYLGEFEFNSNKNAMSTLIATTDNMLKFLKSSKGDGKTDWTKLELQDFNYWFIADYSVFLNDSQRSRLNPVGD